MSSPQKWQTSKAYSTYLFISSKFRSNYHCFSLLSEHNFKVLVKKNIFLMFDQVADLGRRTLPPHDIVTNNCNYFISVLFGKTK